MEDDVESTLAGLERRLRALQSELDEEAAAKERGPRRPPIAAAPEPPRAAEPPGAAAAPPPAGDALADFDDALQRATRELTAAWDRTLAAARGTAEGHIVRGEVALDARADLAGLCALHRALTDIGEVDIVTLRAYAGGHAALDVAVHRPVALLDALRQVLPVTLVEARPGRLGIALD